jgi:Putative Ig domain
VFVNDLDHSVRFSVGSSQDRLRCVDKRAVPPSGIWSQLFVKARRPRRFVLGFVVTIAAISLPATAAAASGPVWAAGAALSLPAGAATAPSSENASLETVACFSHGNCEGVGSYADPSGDTQLMAENEISGAWASPVELGLPGDAFESPSNGPTLNSIACASQGNCVAVGWYQIDANEDELPIVISQSGGVWGQPSGITLPVGAASVPTTLGSGSWVSQLSSVACTSDGNCVAVGQYSDASGYVHAMAVAEVGGQWGSGTEIADPSDSDQRDSSLNGVSCTSVGNCEAVGGVETTADGGQAMVASELGGVWGQASEIAQPSNATTDDISAGLFSVSCVSPGNCEAVGSYADLWSMAGEDLQPMAVAETNGNWQQASEVELPAGANTAADEYSWLASVSCVSVGNCEAGGGYEDNTGEQFGALANESDGVWAQATGVALPPDAASPPNAQSFINSVTCTSLDSCDAAGDYGASAGGSSPLFLSGVPALGLTGLTLPTAIAGDAYIASLSATGGTGNGTWSVTSGSLPAGLSLNPSTGVISGTPTTQTTSTFTIGLSDDGPPVQTASANFSITVDAPTPSKPTVADAPSAAKTTLRSVRLKHHRLEITLSCAGATTQVCKGTLTVTVLERWRGRKLIAVTASAKPKLRTRTIVLAKAEFHTRGQSRETTTISLNALGKQLLSKRHRLSARLTIKLASNRVLLKRAVKLD